MVNALEDKNAFGSTPLHTKVPVMVDHDLVAPALKRINRSNVENVERENAKSKSSKKGLLLLRQRFFLSEAVWFGTW